MPSRALRRYLLPGILFLLLLAVALTGFFWVEIFYPRAKPAITLAITEAQSSPVLEAAVGAPFHIGRFVQGRVAPKGNATNADLILPISGPNGQGQLLEWAQLSAGQWRLCSLIYRSGNRDIILRSNQTAHCEPE